MSYVQQRLEEYRETYSVTWLYWRVLKQMICINNITIVSMNIDPKGIT